jgi:hypothetical protein
MPLLANSCSDKNFILFLESFHPFFWVLFCLGGGGRVLGPLLPRGFGCSLFFLEMVPSLCPSLIQNIFCFHCSSLYTLGDLLRHVKSAHPLASLVSQVSYVIFSLQVFSPPVFFRSSILLVSWGWLWA